MTSVADDRLTAAEVKHLRNAIDNIGTKGVVAILGTSRLALVSAIAGLDVQKGTISLIRQNWSKLVIP
jgi:hypothetical protein